MNSVSNRDFRPNRLVCAFFAAISLAAVTVSGCGGGGGSTPAGTSNDLTGSTASTTRVTATVQWPERTRDISAPSSAQSVVLVLRGARTDGSDFTFVLNRPADDQAVTQEYTSTESARVGEWDTEVLCHADADGGGALVAEATLHTPLGQDGHPLGGPLALRGNIASVSVEGGQEIGVGERKELRFTARNANGEILAILPGAGVFTVTEGGDYLEVVDRRFGRGLRVGNARVIVRVDDVTSTPETIRVVSRVAISIRPERITLAPGGSETFTATVTGTDKKDVVWSIREGSPAGGTITDGGRYTAPQTPGEYHVVVTSKADPTKSAVAVVIVSKPVETVAVSITPKSLTLRPGKSETFHATVTGTDNKDVVWSVREGSPAGGTITDGGRYTAPQTPGEYHVVATSKADPTKSAVAVVIVKAE